MNAVDLVLCLYSKPLPGGRETVVVSLEGDGGTIGLGEASPLPGFSSDTFRDAVTALQSFDVRELPLPGASPGWDARLLRALRNVFRASPAAAMAIETAWIDLAARHERVSFAAFLNNTSDPLRRIPVNILIERGETDAPMARIRTALSQGIRTVKIKVGAPQSLDEDLRLLNAIRRNFGPAPAIRIDANEAWLLEETEENLRQFAPYSMEYCEQPVACGELHRLGPCAVAVAADESLADWDDISGLTGAPRGILERYVAGVTEWEALETHVPRDRQPPVAAFVLKPMVLGGVLRAGRFARLAAACGIQCTVTHLFDGPTAFAACAEFAASLNPPPLACGLFPHRNLESHLPHFDGTGVSSAGLYGLGIDRKAILHAAIPL